MQAYAGKSGCPHHYSTVTPTMVEPFMTNPPSAPLFVDQCPQSHALNSQKNLTLALNSENSLNRLSQINWSVVPEVADIRWYDVMQKRNFAAQSCYIAGGVSAAATTFSATLLSASAATILGLTGLFAIPAVGLLYGGWRLKNMAESKLDPDYRQQKRAELESTITETKLIPTYEQLQELVDSKIIDEQEKQALFHDEIKNYGAVNFFKRFNPAIEILDPANMNLLKDSYIEESAHAQSKGLKEELLSTYSVRLGITERDLAPKLLHKEISNSYYQSRSYSEFVSRNGYTIFPYVLQEPEYLNFLFEKFKEYAVHIMKASPRISVERLFGNDLQAFGIDHREHLLLELAYLALLSLDSEDNDYIGIRRQHHLRHLSKALQELPIAQMQMQKAFLALPTVEILRYFDDINSLGISINEVKEVIGFRWLKKSFQEILRDERAEFFQSFHMGLFTPTEWRNTAIYSLRDSSIHEVIALDKELFVLGVLTPETQLYSGDTVRQALAKDLSRYSDFDSFIQAYDEVIFLESLCDASQPELCRLTYDYVHSYASEFIRNYPEKCLGRALIEKYLLISTEITKLTETFAAEDLLARQGAALAIQAINNAYSLQWAQLEKQKALNVNELEKAHDVIALGAQTERLGRELAESKIKAASVQQAGDRARRSYTQVSRDIESLNDQIRQKQQHKLPSSRAHTSIAIRSDITVCEYKIKQALLQADHDCAKVPKALELKVKIEALKPRYNDLQKKQSDYEECTIRVRKYHMLENEINQKLQLKMQLTCEIEMLKNQGENTQNFFNAVKAYCNPLETKQQALAEIEGKEKELKNLKIEVDLGANLQDRNLELEKVRLELESYTQELAGIKIRIRQALKVSSYESELVALKGLLAVSLRDEASLSNGKMVIEQLELELLMKTKEKAELTYALQNYLYDTSASSVAVVQQKYDHAHGQLQYSKARVEAGKVVIEQNYVEAILEAQKFRDYQIQLETNQELLAHASRVAHLRHLLQPE